MVKPLHFHFLYEIPQKLNPSQPSLTNERVLFLVRFTFLSRSFTTQCAFYTFKAKKKRAWHKQFIGASQRQDNQHHVKQTMIFSPTYDVRREAYQRQGNKLVIASMRDHKSRNENAEMLYAYVLL
jgi:hypothetical protein